MHEVNAVALVVGGVGLLGGIVGAWAAVRTSSRVAVKVVRAVHRDGIAVGKLEQRVAGLERWRSQHSVTAPTSTTPNPSAAPDPAPTTTVSPDPTP